MWVSKDGNDMYLAGWGKPNRSNYGSGDIYVSSRKSKNNWSAPINLGPTINTKHLEDNPYFLEDWQTLYFDSDRPGGYGNRDIYYRVRNKDGSWSKPVNMGAPINTKATEGRAFLRIPGTQCLMID